MRRRYGEKAAKSAIIDVILRRRYAVSFVNRRSGRQA